MSTGNTDTSQIVQAGTAVSPLLHTGGGVCELVGGSLRARAGAAQIMDGFEIVKNIAVNAGLSGCVPAAASMAMLGHIDPTAIFVGAVAGAASSISKGSRAK